MSTAMAVAGVVVGGGVEGGGGVERLASVTGVLYVGMAVGVFGGHADVGGDFGCCWEWEGGVRRCCAVDGWDDVFGWVYGCWYQGYDESTFL